MRMMEAYEQNKKMVYHPGWWAQCIKCNYDVASTTKGQIYYALSCSFSFASFYHLILIAGTRYHTIHTYIHLIINHRCYS